MIGRIIQFILKLFSKKQDKVRKRAESSSIAQPEISKELEKENKLKGRDKKINISIPRRMYWSSEINEGAVCPKCNSILINEFQTYLVLINTDDEGESFLSGNNSGYFCTKCPTVVLDRSYFEKFISTIRSGIKDTDITVPGIVNMSKIPEENDDIPLGEDENPIPLVGFTNVIQTPKRKFSRKSKSKLKRRRRR